jgi:hypothetical protein
LAPISKEIALNNKQSEFYDKDEAKRRFEAALRGARITGHKPMAEIPKKRKKSQDESRTDQAT